MRAGREGLLFIPDYFNNLHGILREKLAVVYP
jgi:hypothetical protein